MYTVDRNGVLARVPAYDVKPAPRPPTPEDSPRSPLSTVTEEELDPEDPAPPEAPITESPRSPLDTIAEEESDPDDITPPEPPPSAAPPL